MKRFFLIPIILMIITCVFAQENQHLSLEGKWPYGISYTMEMEGDIVFTTDGAILQIYDFSNPASPVLMSETLCANIVQSMRIVGNKAYVASYEGSLIIFDISDLYNPLKLGEVETVTHLVSVDVKGDYAYLASYENGITIVDIANATNPVVVNHMFTGVKLYKVLVHEQYLFVSGLQQGIRVYSLDTPYTPSFISSTNTTSTERDMKIIGDRLYSVSSQFGILTLDISDVLNIQLISFSGTSHQPLSVDVDGQTALVCEYDHGITLYDLSDESNPVIIGQFEGPPISRKAVLKGQNVILSGIFKLLSLDISNPLEINEIHRIGFHGPSRFLAQWENRLYIAGSNNPTFTYPIRILDITDPTHPVEAPLNLPAINDASSVYAEDGLLFVADYGWIKIFDIQDASLPILYDSIWCGDGSPLMHKHNNLLFLTSNSSLKIYDISDLNQAILLGTIDKYITGMATHDHYLLIGTYSHFAIYDIANPSSPVEIFNKSFFPTKSVAWGNNRIYLLTRNASLINNYCLEVYNTSDMTNITPEAKFSCGISDGSIAVEGDFLYVSDWDYGLQMYDISDPTSAELCGYSPRLIPILRFTVRSPFVYIPINQGVEILRNDLFVHQNDFFLPSEIRLKVYPNPVTELMSFDLPDYDPGSTYLYKITDMNGKTIREGKALHATVHLNMSGLPPAVYYLQVEKNKQFYKAALIVKQ
jgi:hypothetical protein